MLGAAEDWARHARAAAADAPAPAARDAGVPARIVLAEAWTPAYDPTGWWVSEKLDGVRALWRGDALWPRAGVALGAPAFFTAALPRGVELDGEVFAGRGKFQATVKIVRGGGGAAEVCRGLRFAVLDAPGAPGAHRRA